MEIKHKAVIGYLVTLSYVWPPFLGIFIGFILNSLRCANQLQEVGKIVI
jgi:hypothetical protein